LIIGIKNEDLRMKLMQETFENFKKAIAFAQLYVTAKDAVSATNTQTPIESSASVNRMSTSSVKAAKSRQNKILMPIKVNGTSIQMEFDPGAGASIISKEKFDSLFPKVTLRPSLW